MQVARSCDSGSHPDDHDADDNDDGSGVDGSCDGQADALGDESILLIVITLAKGRLVPKP